MILETKNLLKKILPKSLRNNIRTIEWQLKGKPIPVPPFVKQSIIKQIQQKYDLQTFVETGTYLGEMVDAQKNNFEKIISIELDLKLYESAKNKFKDFNHIEILQGDSGEILKSLLPKIKEPCLFWLDAHYSAGFTAKGKKETPIIEELDSILKTEFNHVLLIDDARCFSHENGYPTISEITECVNNKRPNSYSIKIENDIIRIEPRI